MCAHECNTCFAEVCGCTHVSVCVVCPCMYVYPRELGRVVLLRGEGAGFRGPVGQQLGHVAPFLPELEGRFSLPPCRGIPMARVGDGAGQVPGVAGAGRMRTLPSLACSLQESVIHTYTDTVRTQDTHAHRTMSAPTRTCVLAHVYTNNCFLSLMSTNMSHGPAHTHAH